MNSMIGNRDNNLCTEEKPDEACLLHIATHVPRSNGSNYKNYFGLIQENQTLAVERSAVKIC